MDAFLITLLTLSEIPREAFVAVKNWRFYGKDTHTNEDYQSDNKLPARS